MSSSGPEQATAVERHVCAGCGATLQVEARHRGRRLRCSRCGTEFVVPGAAGTGPPSRPCPACGTPLAVRPELVGRRVRCQRCGSVFTLEAADVPRTAPPASATPPAPEEPAAREAPSTGAATPTTGTSTEGAPQGSAGVPPSYSHTCTACGARFRVYARYYGRTLRCTGCGEEFAASPPPFVPVGPPPEPAAPHSEDAASATAARDRRWRRAATAAAVVIALGGGLWWLGTAHHGGVGGRLFAAARTRGEIGRLQGPGGGPALVGLDRDAGAELSAALEAGNEGGLASLRSSQHCLELESGTRVRVLDGGGRSGPTRVRVLSGPWSSRVVWAPARSIR